ncbi:MAG: lysylphosphatidylglycerol synthase domain-containing protein [Bacteroidota bacterium]
MSRKTLFKIIKYTIILLIFFFILKYFYENRYTLNYNQLHFNFMYLGISVLIYVAHIFINAAVWYIITKQNNCNIPFFETIKMRIYSDFGKYIPGKIVAYGILFYSYNQKSISKKRIAVCSFQELIMGTLAAIVIALVSIYFSDIALLRKYYAAFLVMAVVCLIVIYPPVLEFTTNKIMKLLRREPISIISNYAQLVLVLLLFVISWLVFGLGFYFFINSFYTYSISYYFFTTGAFAIAGLLGFVAIFAPAGLGVREGALVFILGYVFTRAISVIISLLSRVWMIFCELIFFLCIFVLSYCIKKPYLKQSTPNEKL